MATAKTRKMEVPTVSTSTSGITSAMAQTIVRDGDLFSTYDLISSLLFEIRRLLQDRGILSRISETAATARLQVGVMLVHERSWGCWLLI